MNDDEQDDQPNTFLIDNDPAKMLPFSKRLVPEDSDAIDAGRHFMRDSVVNPGDVEL